MAHSVSNSGGSGTIVTLLFDASGQRKYLTPTQRREFLRVAQDAAGPVSTFCATLGLTGCRISEALGLTGSRVDVAGGILLFESLKKRRRGIYRGVPVPPAFLETLASVHDLLSLRDARLWEWSRTTAWRRVKEVLDAAEIRGLCASPKGVRHAFGIKAVTSEVPLPMIQKWLGHSRLATTAIYTNAIGPEEQEIARRMWDAYL
jgi:integrase/recombinase XerD